jgi:hypothetical protein
VSEIERSASDLRRFAECSHDFKFEGDTIEHGVVGVCRVCRCRVTAWPGGVHYDEINERRKATK